MATFKIHPAIGIARLGDSDTEFYLSPEQPGALPTACGNEGNAIIVDGKEQPITTFRDLQKRIKRQAARFRVFVYDDDKNGRELKNGDQMTFWVESSTSGLTPVDGVVQDIEWTVHLANKKATWYEFQQTDGMHGYAPDHPLRNPTFTQPDQRRTLMIDPGAQTVSYTQPENRAKSFAQGANPGYPQLFPPADLIPAPITTLGDLKATRQDNAFRLLVLGGYGRSGSIPVSQPAGLVLEHYANNDGWFDDVSDGPVTAQIVFQYDRQEYDKDGNLTTVKATGKTDVNVPAWVVVGYPRYAPEIVDMITMDDTMYDVFVRSLAYQPSIFGVPPYTAEANSPKTATEWQVWQQQADWNEDYYPRFYAEIWPILQRPNGFAPVLEFDFFGGSDPHNTGTGGNLDEDIMSTPPQKGGIDPNRAKRQKIYEVLRKIEEVNLAVAERGGIELPHTAQLATSLQNAYGSAERLWSLMPKLCGHNPLSNVVPEKFLHLTPTQLFLLHQWADGKFVNECAEWGGDTDACKNPFENPPTTGIGLDRGVLGNIVGGAFCPGAELAWIMTNPAIYKEPYRINHATYEAGQLTLPANVADLPALLSNGLEPGDLTKYMALPWQADYNQCTYQDVDVTYEAWNLLYLSSTGDPAVDKTVDTIPWWPAHRPMVVQIPSGQSVYWASGIPMNNVGNVRMVTGWKDLGFIKADQNGSMVMIERNDDALGPPIPVGNLILGGTKNTKRSNRG